MSFSNTFREVAISVAPQQEKTIDKVLLKAPALAMVPTYETTDGFEHVYEVVLNADSMQVVNLDDNLPLVDSNTDLRRTQIGFMGGEIAVPEDKAKARGGATAYFQKKLPRVYEKTGMNMEKGVFMKTLLPAIKAHSGSAGDAMHPGAAGTAHADFFKKVTGGVADNVEGEWIICIKFEEDVLCGLHDPAFFGGKEMFNEVPLSGGNLHKFGASYGKDLEGKNGYAMRMKSNYGILIADGDNASGMYGASLAESVVDGKTVYSGIPTSGDLARMINLIQGDNNNTMFFCSPAMLHALEGYFGTNDIQYTNPVTNVVYSFKQFNNIPFVASYNFTKVAYDNI